MNTMISGKMKKLVEANSWQTMTRYIDSAYNYRINAKGFHGTFLEFGATGCISCKMMERVMEEVKSRYPSKIQVTFINILLPLNQELMKYYAVTAIPTQVILDKSGNEIFRHTGYFSVDDLEKVFKEIQN